MQFRMTNLAVYTLAICALLLSAPVEAFEADVARLPSCTSASVQSAVSGALTRAERFYEIQRTVTGIHDAHELNVRDDGISHLARRFCSGTATLTDGTNQTVHYKLVQHGGFVGLGWKVDACLSSLDKWHVYGRNCSTTRPR